MVHIKEIRMTGWKSYGPGTVRMPLAKGFTVIVGPNGSGKSNSIDGVNFCLGTLSSKSMRADKMVSLIYNGIGGKKPAERAIVEIVFDNSDYAIPIKEKEVIVSREIRRNGSTTYRLNGKRTTRTDILDKLRIAGIDVINSYNIIAQGQVSEIVGMNPIQRRKLMENLAGVGQFDDKKKSALSELDEANRRMDELQLLVNEVANRVASLRKEKEDAERWNQLDQEIVRLKTLLISYDYYKYHDEITRFDKEITVIREEQELLINERKEMNDKIEEVVEKIKNLENQLIRLETEVKEIRSSAEEKNIEKTKISEQIEYNKKTIKSNENRLTQLKQRIEQIQKRMEEDIKTKEQLEEAKKELNEKIEETQQLKSEIEAELEQKNSLYDEIKNEYDDAERRYKIENDRLTKTQVQFEVSQNMVSAFENNVKEYEKRKREMEEQIAATQQKSVELKKHIDEDSLQLEEAKSKIGGIESKKNKIDEAIESYDLKARELNDKYLVQRAQADTISSFLKAESGKENPAVTFISEKSSKGEVLGVLGPFQNLSDEGKSIPPEVGHLADAIITDTISTALTCINLLKEHAVGAANFIPLEKFKLKPEDQFDRIVKKIREQNIVAPTIEEAANIWRKSNQTISTTDGDIFYSNGIIFGGFHLVSAQESVNKLQEEMKITKQKIDEITEKLKEQQENKKKILQLEKIITSSIEKLEKNIRDSTIALTQQENEIRLYKDNLKKIEEESAPLQAQLEERLKSREQQQKEIEFYEQSLEKISLEISDVEARLEAADTRPILERLNQVEQKLGQLQGKFSGISSR
ncbi:MAG: AAA family ATPase, partial [Candidatus Hodarchaeales archaeon]